MKVYVYYENSNVGRVWDRFFSFFVFRQIGALFLSILTSEQMSSVRKSIYMKVYVYYANSNADKGWDSFYPPFFFFLAPNRP